MYDEKLNACIYLQNVRTNIN
uniref:Uncharacterized protein n=1 Tax=Anguilla anguilla TaxID=7936 RepID=A0A0E9UPI1_ANGAN